MELRSVEEVLGFVKNNSKCLILCKTHTCKVCLAVDARFKKSALVYKGWQIGYVYIDDLALFRGQYSVFTVPTVLMFFEQKEIYRTSRFIDFERLEYFVDATA